MKKIYILMLVLLGTVGFAQNSDIFGGGIGDGWSYGYHMQWTNDIYVGGSGEGWSSNASSLTVLDIGEVNLDSKIYVYPNPTQDKLLIEYSSSVISLKIYDMNRRSVISASNVNIISLANLSVGTYYLLIETNEGHSIKKIIKN